MRSIFPVVIAVLMLNFTPDTTGKRDPTPANQEQLPIFSFGVIADVQYCDCDAAGSRFYRSSLTKLKDAINSLRTDNPSFVFNLGDLIEKDFSSYKPVYSIFDTAGFIIYHTTGNHDYSVEPRLKKSIPPHNKNKEGYYSFNYLTFRFIVLNGNELSTYSTNNKSEIKKAEDYILNLKNSGEINGQDWNGGISTTQMVWLTNQLITAKKNNEKVFIICHFPVFPFNEHNLLNYRDVLSVLEGYDNIIAWFNGHNHAGNYGNFNSTHFITFKGMVETEMTNSFALIEVYKNKIWIKGSGREKSQILAY
jgi:manganese-dependent ADP-ribose/CDP-alcohol diphosphatase